MSASRRYAVPAVLIAAQVALSLFFVLTDRLPDPAVVTHWPTGVSSHLVPFWAGAWMGPAVSLFTLGAMALSAWFPVPKRWQPEDWRSRGVWGPETNAFLGILLLLHGVGLMNLASRWTLDQGMVQSLGGMAIGVLLIVMGNYQPKLASVGVWALTPWRLESLAARQRCQRFASRAALVGGLSVVGMNVVCFGSAPLLRVGDLPLHPQLVASFGAFLVLYAGIAVVTKRLALES